jgi:hypothetical protein
VILHLKEDAAELADPIRLQRLIKQYSQFIQFPIKLWNSRKEPQQVVDEEATKKAQEEEDKKAAEGTEAKKVSGHVFLHRCTTATTWSCVFVSRAFYHWLVLCTYLYRACAFIVCLEVGVAGGTLAAMLFSAWSVQSKASAAAHEDMGLLACSPRCAAAAAAGPFPPARWTPS